MSSRTLPAMSSEYHQTHQVYGLPACPLCGWKSLIVRSYQKAGEPRQYYTACDHEECEGLFEGPTRSSTQEAGQAVNERLRKFAISFTDGAEGVYDI